MNTPLETTSAPLRKPWGHALHMLLSSTSFYNTISFRLRIKMIDTLKTHKSPELFAKAILCFNKAGFLSPDCPNAEQNYIKMRSFCHLWFSSQEQTRHLSQLCDQSFTQVMFNELSDFTAHLIHMGRTESTQLKSLIEEMFLSLENNPFNMAHKLTEHGIYRRERVESYPITQEEADSTHPPSSKSLDSGK